MMRRALIVLTTVFILTTLASAAQAQLSRMRQLPRGDRWDFTIQTRYTSAKDYSGDGGSSVAINADLGWGFGFGYNFNQHFNLGLLFAWRSVPYQTTAVDAEDPTQTSCYSGTMSTSTFGLSGEYNVLKGLSPRT